MTEQEEFEFRARMEAESAAEAPRPRTPLKFDRGAPTGGDSTTKRALAGAGLGVSDLGNTVLNVMSYLPGKMTDAVRSALPAEHRKRVPDISQWTRTRNADFEALTEQNKDSTAFNVGRVGGNVAATLPVGGVAAGGIKSLAALPRLAPAAPALTRLANATASGGMRTGANLAANASRGAKAANMGTRLAGGAIAGGTSSALVHPEDAGTGALIGAALPPALSGIGKGARYLGGAAKSLVQPLTQTGQQNIAAKIIQQFGDGGPMEINAGELVAGSRPTLAEATGNAGVASLQRASRDLRPNAFVEREAANNAARTAAFDGIAGDAAGLRAANAARDEAADTLYGRAFAADAMRQDMANTAQRTRAPFKGVGLSGAREDLATPGLRELMSRPMFRQAAEDAKRLAANRGVRLDDPLQSLEGLHFIKLALDDALNPAAKSAMGRNASSAVMSMRDKLADELAKVSPLYGNARKTFAEMSQPGNAMEALQGLNLTTANGNMTLNKVTNAVNSLEKLRKAPGVNPAKSVTQDQLKKLEAIRADLLRQDLLNGGRSAGSNTFQNITTNNILSSFLPGNAGALAQNKLGGVVGQAGKLLYSGSDDAIRAQLVDMMLDPELARAVLARQAAIGAPSTFERLLLSPGVNQPLARVAPQVGSDRP